MTAHSTEPRVARANTGPTEPMRDGFVVTVRAVCLPFWTTVTVVPVSACVGIVIPDVSAVTMSAVALIPAFRLLLL